MTDELNRRLMSAVIHGDLEGVNLALKQGADIHYNNDCALKAAAETGHLQVVKYLVENGADIHVLTKLFLTNVLNKGNSEVYKYLSTKIKLAVAHDIVVAKGYWLGLVLMWLMIIAHVLV